MTAYPVGEVTCLEFVAGNPQTWLSHEMQLRPLLKPRGNLSFSWTHHSAQSAQVQVSCQ
jgi:hypothetical protein